VSLKSWLPLNAFSGFTAGGNGADCWGYTSPTGREYALMGLSWGNGIVEVTDPANPVIIATIPGGVDILWRDIAVIGHYAYAVSDSAGVGIQVINLANIDAGSVTLVRNYSQGGHTRTHTLIDNPASGFMYACGGNAAGGRTIPVSVAADPTYPTFVGVASPDTGQQNGYVHEALAINYTSGPYAGKEIVFLFKGQTGMQILDWTNKSAPISLFEGSYPGERYGHQGWISEDRKYLYLNDELDGPSNGLVPRFLTRVFDVSDLSAPRLVSTITNGLPAVDHNEYVKGRYLYQSNYTSGLRIWDLTHPLKPYEVAWIDTRPEDDGTGYNGAWGNYPFFNSGTILISDIERGLFVVKMSILEFDNTIAYPTVLGPGQATPVTVKLAGYDGATPGAVNLRVSVNGAAYSTYPLTHSGNGIYTGQIPATNGFDRVKYYFEALTSEASPRTFTWPLDAANGQVFTAYTQSSEQVLFSDNFETNLGWTVTTTPINGTASGAWTRAIPAFNNGPGAVIGDADGSGRCFLTGSSLNADVDFCTTVLTSPVLDLSQAPEARISYSRWLLSIVGTEDSLNTEVSSNNGSTWTPVHSVSPVTGGWERVTFRVADYITPTNQVRIRFVVSDPPRQSGNPPTWVDDSITEAGIDWVVVVNPVVNTVCYANCDGSSGSPLLTANDFQCFLNKFAAGEPSANCDGSSGSPLLTANDFQCFLNKFAAGCS
jgi:choice-of-anchor B domain-containing protein